jgi:hypothetical protein
MMERTQVKTVAQEEIRAALLFRILLKAFSYRGLQTIQRANP